MAKQDIGAREKKRRGSVAIHPRPFHRVRRLVRLCFLHGISPPSRLFHLLNHLSIPLLQVLTPPNLSLSLSLSLSFVFA
jgi:hypothetical protein